MKNLIAIVTMIFSVALANAQNYEVLYMQDIHNEDVFLWCVGTTDGVIIYGNPACGATNHWNYGEGTVYCDSIVLICDNQPQQTQDFEVFHLCGSGTTFHVVFIQTDIENPFPEPVMWKRQGESVTLTAGQAWWYYHWSNGSTENQIEVTDPGTYTVNISDSLCLDRTFSIEVRDNVELFRATVDLASNLNKVTWQTTPEQSEYISQVKVERDGFVVGTAPYTDGYFIDNIGSENAARNYRLTGIDTDGEECPIPSYQYGTLHVDFSPNASNPNKLNMAWTAPFIEEGAPLAVTYFQICKYDPNTGEVTVVDQISANNTIGSYDVSLFDGGYATVAAVFSEGRDYEELSFSNLTDEVLGIGENAGKQFKIYPNPVHNVLFVETRRATSLPTETEYRITNLMGQTLMSGTVETCHGASLQQINIENLPQGIYFVTIGGMARKFVVE